MDDIENLIEALRTCYAALSRLRQIEGPELLLPGRTETYHNVLEDAYSAFARVETAVDALGQQLEHEHTRLDEGERRYGPHTGDQDTQAS